MRSRLTSREGSKQAAMIQPMMPRKKLHQNPALPRPLPLAISQPMKPLIEPVTNKKIRASIFYSPINYKANIPAINATATSTPSATCAKIDGSFSLVRSGHLHWLGVRPVQFGWLKSQLLGQLLIFIFIPPFCEGYHRQAFVTTIPS